MTQFSYPTGEDEAAKPFHCPCHAATLTASSASEAIPDYVEQLCRDIYAHFHLSPKKLCAYKEFQTLRDTKPHKF